MRQTKSLSQKEIGIMSELREPAIRSYEVLLLERLTEWYA